MSGAVIRAIDDVWAAMGYELIGRKFRFAEAPSRTFVVEGRTESGRLQVCVQGWLTTYSDPKMLAQSFKYGLIEEVVS